MNNSILLAVDDKPDNLFVLEQLISEYCPSCKIITAQNAEQGLKLAKQVPLDIAIIDVQMPDIDGIEMCKKLKADFQTAHVPIILLTAHRASTALKVRGLEAGADDFITKPIDAFEFTARIKVMLRIKKAEDILRKEKDGLKETVSKKSIQLEKAEKRYKILFDNANDAIFVRDYAGNILDANKVACNCLGYSRETLLKIDGTEILTPENVALLPERNRLLCQKGGLVFESALKCRDGKIIPIEVSARVIEYNKKQAVLTHCRDIRQHKQTEAENKRLQAQLQQAQKMEAVGTLAGGIAHDFNNILFPIIGYAEMTLDDIPEGSQAHNNILEVLKAAKRAAKLVEHILTFSRSGNQGKSILKVQLIVKEALKLLRATIPKTININQDINENCGAIFADPTQIHQIIMNLCTNAYQSMAGESGEIHIALSQVTISADDHIGSLNKKPGHYLRLMVSDTGKGMDQHVIERIFEPYFTTKEKTKGTGLGLAVVHGIIKNHDGEITVFSEPDVGTTFYVYMPIVQNNKESPDFFSEQPPMKGNEHILLVDDEPQIVLMEKQMLQRLGYSITAKTNSIEALELFTHDPYQFDLVITDQAMPDMAGVQLALNMMKIRPDIPIILCTGFSEFIEEEQAKAMGIREFIMKPIVTKKLTDAIRRVMC